MPFKIQRVPRGLDQLLSTFGGQTPIQLADDVRAIIDLLQFYGLTQRSHAAGAVAGVGSSLINPQVTITPSLTNWSILFTAMAGIQPIAAATTWVGFGPILARAGTPGVSGFSILKAYEAAPPVGANAFAEFVAPYPMLLPPGTQVGCLMWSTLGAGAQNVTISAEFGLLG